MKAHVVVAGTRDVRAAVEALYQSNATSIRRVIAVYDPPIDGEAVRALQDARPELVALRNETALGMLGGWNRGMTLRETDVLLLGEAAALAAGALREMLEVLHGSDRNASVVPSPVPRAAPRTTQLPAPRGGCMLLRHVVVNLIGGFDPGFTDPLDALDDWAMRAERMGFRHVRANRALAAPPPAADPAARRFPALLLARHPHLPDELAEHHDLPDRCEVVEAPFADVAALVAALRRPAHLVIRAPARWRDRALLLAAAHAAQRVLAQSEAERHALAAELSLDPARIAIAAPAEDLFAHIVAAPDEAALRYRARLLDYLA